MLPDDVRQAVEDALRARLGGSVSVTAVEQFRPSFVFRCVLQSSVSAAPKTVIVRVPREGTARSGRIGLHNERAALECLIEIGSALAPRVLAGGSEDGFLVTEDLGNHPSLLNLLLGQDPEAARQGAVAFAHGLGRLHAQTAGLAERLRAGLPVAHVPVAERWRQVQGAVAELGLPAPDGVNGDVERITRLLAKPGGCLALSSGDASVVNCKVSGGDVKFFDFEEACFRHPYVDTAVLRYPYPTGGPPWCLPREVASQMEAAYRAELAQDDEDYECGMGAACAAWTIIRLARLPQVEAGPDRDSWHLLPPVDRADPNSLPSAAVGIHC